MPGLLGRKFNDFAKYTQGFTSYIKGALAFKSPEEISTDQRPGLIEEDSIQRDGDSNPPSPQVNNSGEGEETTEVSVGSPATKTLKESCEAIVNNLKMRNIDPESKHPKILLLLEDHLVFPLLV